MPSPFESEDSFRSAVAVAPLAVFFECYKKAWEGEGKNSGSGKNSGADLSPFLMPIQKILGKTMEAMQKELTAGLREDIYAPRPPRRR